MTKHTAFAAPRATLPTPDAADHTARPRGPIDNPLSQRDAEADGAVQHGILALSPRAARLIIARTEASKPRKPLAVADLQPVASV